MAEPLEDRPALPPEELEARRTRLAVIVTVAVVVVGGLWLVQRLAARSADDAAERLRAELDADALGVHPADVPAALTGASDGPAAALLARAEFRTYDQPDPELVRIVYRPTGWQAGIVPRCIVLVLRPTDHELLVRGRNCGLERPKEG